MSLDWNNATFHELLNQTTAMVTEIYEDLDNHRVIQATDPEQVRNLFAQDLPELGMDPSELLKEVQKQVVETASFTMGPNFFAYVGSGGTQVGVAAEYLAAALDQNPGKWHLSPPGAELEKLTIRWLGKLIGYSDEAVGVMVSGGSNANLHCLTTARHIMAPWDVTREGMSGKPQMVAYASSEVHFCVDKSLASLGIGMDGLRKIPVGEDMTIDLAILEAAIREDRARGHIPFCIIGNAGSVNTGAVDPLDKLADLAKAYGLWFHVDAAYGGPAASLPEKQALFRGLDRADSVAMDPHKWLYIPFEAGVALIRNVDELRQTYELQPSYLATDQANTDRFDLHQHSFQLSRNFKALKVWMTLRAYGAHRIRQEIRQNIETVNYLEDQVRASEDFEVVKTGPLSALCFRYTAGAETETELNQRNAQLLAAAEEDGRVFITGTMIDGKRCLRVCLVNHRSGPEFMDRLLKVLREVAARMDQAALVA